MLARNRQPELMDQPTIDRKEHEMALQGLAKLNAVSGAAMHLWQPLKDCFQPNAPIKILDIATGSADVLLGVWQLAKQQGWNLTIEGCDISATAIECAQSRAQKLNASCRFFQLDALQDEIPAGYDIIMCSQFLHHLDEDEVVLLLQKMAKATTKIVLVSDLIRSYANLLLVQLAVQMLTPSAIVHFDGPASVRAAFTPLELEALATRAGLHNIKIKRQFPCRTTMLWKKTLD